MKRKLLSLLLVATMMSSALVGCNTGGKDAEVTKATDEFIEEVDKLMGDDSEVVAGEEKTETVKKEVTAESLFTNAVDESENTSMDLNLVMKLSMDASAMGADAEGMTVSGKIDLGVEASIKTETDEDTVHSYGNMKLNMFGMDIEVPMDEYYDLSTNPYTAYKATQDANGGIIWDLETVDEVPNSLTNVDFSNVNDEAKIELLPEDTDEDYYVVEALVTDMDMSSFEELTGQTMEDMELPMFFYFDKETEKLSHIETDMTDILKAAGEVEGVTFEEFSFSITINDFNSDVNIPEEVIKYAGATTSVADSEIAVAANPNSEGKTLLEAYWGTSDYAYNSDMAKLIGIDEKMFDDAEWGRVYISISNFLNNYTEKELLDYLEYFQYSSEHEQIALVKIAQYLDGKSTNYNSSVLDEVLGNNRNYEDALELIEEYNL